LWEAAESSVRAQLDYLRTTAATSPPGPSRQEGNRHAGT